MKNRKKTIIYTILSIVVLFGVSYIYAHIDKNSYLYDRNADTGTYYGTGILMQEEEVSQTFVAKEDNIDGINIKVSITGNVENVVLHYTLIDEATGTRSEATVKASELENNKFNHLPIDKIIGTKGKSYKLILNVENSDEQSGIAFYVERSQQNGQKLVVKENEAEGTLVARVVSHRFDLETFIVFIGIIIFIVAFMKVLYKSFK